MMRAAAVLVSSLALAAAPAAVHASTPKLVKVDVGKAETKSVTVHVGQTLAIRLADCADCGYTWKRTQLPNRSILALGPVNFVSSAPKGSVGGTGIQSFRFFPKHTGTTIVRFAYFPPGSSATDRPFNLTVTVK